MAINDDLLYEVNEDAVFVIVKSIESTQQAFLRFTNLTTRPVDVWWRDFKGKRRHYVTLAPNASYDVNSFLTHPWEFTDAQTKEIYRVNNKEIFRAPANVGGMRYRTNWNVTTGVRTLRNCALLAIALRVPHPETVLDLQLPRGLDHELQELIEKLHVIEPGAND